MQLVGSFDGAVRTDLLGVKTEGAEDGALEEGGSQREGQVGHLVDGSDSAVEDPVVDLAGAEGGVVPGLEESFQFGEGESEEVDFEGFFFVGGAWVGRGGCLQWLVGGWFVR